MIFSRPSAGASGPAEYPTVADFSYLPDATLNAGNIYVVLSSSGIWLINYHEAGMYRSNGVVWQYIGSQVETTSIKVGNSTVVGAPVTLNAGSNISLTVDLPTKTITISSTGGGGGGDSVYFPDGW